MLRAGILNIDLVRFEAQEVMYKPLKLYTFCY